MIALLLATRNVHKAQEIRQILGDTCTCVTLNEFPQAPGIVEDANSFAGNATKKSVPLAKWLSQLGPEQTRAAWVLADDSGLEVDALGGAPGVHSARFAAVGKASSANSSDSENNAKLLDLLKSIPAEKRTARFRCVLALTPVLQVRAEMASPVCSLDENEFDTELFEGTCEGWIAFGPRGDGGFGYDPLFVPNGYDKTFAQLGEEIKNRLSHRAKALELLKQRLSKLI
jgi:XTP/dITP diphosphohydrolase